MVHPKLRAAVLAALGVTAIGTAAEAGLTFDRFDGIGGGTAVNDLTSNPAYPNSPTSRTVVPTAEIPVDAANQYGAHLYGFFTPQTTGVYDFYLASDDGGRLNFDPTGANPSSPVTIATEPQWNDSRDYSTSARRTAGAEENRSTTLFPNGFTLTAGQPYFIEGLMKEGGGGDNLSIAADLRSNPATPDPIPTVPMGEVGSEIPASALTVPEPGAAALGVAAVGGLVLQRRRRKA